MPGRISYSPAPRRGRRDNDFAKMRISKRKLSGTERNEPDTEYGYIVPGKTIDDLGIDEGIRVEMFVEGPPMEAAKKIIRRGHLTVSTTVELAEISSFERVNGHRAEPFPLS